MLEIPVEALIATYPRAIDVRGVTLRPMTLGDAILLSVLGVNFNAGTTEPQALMAGLLLSGRVDSESIFCEKVVTRQLRRLLAKIGKHHVDELHQAVDAIIDKSFLTKIKFAVPKGAPIQISPDGLGWPLVLAEEMCSSYGWSFERAIDTPVARAFALHAANHRRNGGKFGAPDYVERMEIAKKNKEP